MPFTTIPTRTTADPNSAADVNTLMENSTFTKSSRNRADGLLLSNSPGDTDHDITIAAGTCKDSTFVYTLELTSALTKRIDAAWSAGDNGGFLDTGSVAINTQYAVWLIRKDSDGTSDAVASTSFTSPSMPGGYTYKRLLRGFATDGSANIINNQWLITDVVNDRSANIVVLHQETSGTHGGTYTAGAWRTSPLNTVVVNEIPGASLASNQITLPAGTYLVNANIVLMQIGEGQARIYDVTSSATLAYGVNGRTYSPDSSSSPSLIIGKFTLTGAKAIEIQAQGSVTISSFGFGYASGLGTETYAEIEITKIG